MGNMRKIKRGIAEPKAKTLIGIPIGIGQSLNVGLSAFCCEAYARKVAGHRILPSRSPELGRNRIITEFLSNPAYAGFEYLFFCDSDTYPENPYAIERLMSHNKPFVAGITPICMETADGQQLPIWSYRLPPDKDGEKPKLVYLKDELPDKIFKAYATGGTTQLIRRDVLMALTPPYQFTLWNNSVTDYKMSEDHVFSEKIKAAGFDLWIDPTVVCHHWHNFDLLRLMELLKS
jgi:hypothetical protein